jgi:hypothetical protein
MAKKPRKGLVVADFHCGHKVGFTPPKYDYETERNKNLYATRRAIWDWTYKEAKKRGPYDFMIFNGDAIDGKGDKSGGTEQLEIDRNVQCQMAIDALKKFNVPKIYMSYGTPYHTGVEEDYEDNIANRVGAIKIGGEDNLDVNGCIINYRHFVSRSSIPHGRHTSIAKERLWNVLWAMRGEYPMANIIIRSHVHYHTYAGGPGWVAIITPALQNYGSKYGSRVVTGEVDIGFVVLEIRSREDFSWEVPILRMPLHEPLSL